MSLTVPPATEFPVLAQEGLVYLDSAATSQTPRPVIEAMDRYYTEYRASIHRGVYPLAAEATEAYEGAREKVAAFAGSTAGETIFTRNGTEAIKACHQGSVQSRRNSKRRRRDAVQCACLVAFSNSRFYNGLRQLLDKKRNAIRALNDLLDNLLG